MKVLKGSRPHLSRQLVGVFVFRVTLRHDCGRGRGLRRNGHDGEQDAIDLAFQVADLAAVNQVAVRAGRIGHRLDLNDGGEFDFFGHDCGGDVVQRILAALAHLQAEPFGDGPSFITGQAREKVKDGGFRKVCLRSVLHICVSVNVVSFYATHPMDLYREVNDFF